MWPPYYSNMHTSSWPARSHHVLIVYSVIIYKQCILLISYSSLGFVANILEILIIAKTQNMLVQVNFLIINTIIKHKKHILHKEKPIETHFRSLYSVHFLFFNYHILIRHTMKCILHFFFIWNYFYLFKNKKYFAHTSCMSWQLGTIMMDCFFRKFE